MKFLSGTLALLLALSLAACNSTKFDPKAATHIQTVALEGPLDPPYYIVSMYDANTAQPAVEPYAYRPMQPGGAVGGLIGAWIADAGDSDVDAALTQKLVNEQDLRLGAELQSALAKALTGAGYDVVVTTPKGEGEVEHDASNTASATPEADAHLKVAFLYAGYVDQVFVPYEPLVWVSVALTDTKTGKELFRQRYNYSTHTGNLDDVRFDPDRKYDFSSDEDLLTDAARTAEGLRAPVPLIAADVAAKLKRQP